MPICLDCNGTGADAKKTAAARQTGACDKHSYIACWTCCGNGLEPIYPGRRSKPLRPAITVVRGNDLYFPHGNENGDFYEPLWLASCGPIDSVHGRTRFTAMLACARRVRAWRSDKAARSAA